MTSKARNVLSAARVRVVKVMPYFRAVLFQLRPVESPGLGTMGVSDDWRLFWDEKPLLKWGADGTAAVLVHEVMHVIRRHAERCKGRDPKRWNLACDAEINDDQPVGMSLPGKPVMPSDFGREAGLLAETYYTSDSSSSSNTTSGPGQSSTTGEGKSVLEGGESSPSGGENDEDSPAPGCGGSCGGCVGNPHEVESETNGVQPVTSAVKELSRKLVAQAVVEHEKSQGSVAGGLSGWAKQELRPPTIPWRQRLASLVRGSMNTIAGRVDYSHRRPGRRYYAMRKKFGRRTPVSPSMVQPVPKVGVVVDVSGSMSDELADAFGEVVGLVEAAGGEATVYAADTEVRAEVKVRTASDLKKLDKNGGMGGTCMEVAMRQAVEKKKHDLLVVVTDGYTGWPEKGELKRVRLLAVITKHGRKAPDWMPQVKING